MDRIDKRLRRYTQPQILAIGAVTLVAWFALLIVVVSPLLAAALAGLGTVVSSLVTVAVVLGGIIAGINYIGKFFGQALLHKEADEALESLALAFAESKERNDG